MEHPDPSRRTPWHVALAIIVPTLVGFAAGKHALFAGFNPQMPGQTALLALRAILVASVALATRERADGARTRLVIAFLFGGSLVVPGGVVALILVGAIVLARLPAVRVALAGAARGWITGAVGIVVVAIVAMLGHKRRETTRFPTSNEDPRTSALAWLDVGNRYRARSAALLWAKREGNDPGEAYFFLARMDHELGYEAKSRKALEKIRARSTSEASRLKAAELLGEAAP